MGYRKITLRFASSQSYWMKNLDDWTVGAILTDVMRFVLAILGNQFPFKKAWSCFLQANTPPQKKVNGSLPSKHKAVFFQVINFLHQCFGGLMSFRLQKCLSLVFPWWFFKVIFGVKKMVFQMSSDQNPG